MITLLIVILLIRSNLLDLHILVDGFLIHLLIQLDQRYQLYISKSPANLSTRKKFIKKINSYSCDGDPTH
jgi:hypothetical protein